MLMDINPLEANVVFNVGQVLILILGAFTIVAAIFKGIFKLTDQAGPEGLAEKWLERFFIGLLYTGLVWLGLSMIISYFGVSVIDVVNGVLLIGMMITSVVKRVSSDQEGANKTLAFSYVALAVMLIWHFIYGSVMHNFPVAFLSSVGDHIMPSFFTDVFKLWGWG